MFQISRLIIALSSIAIGGWLVPGQWPVGLATMIAGALSYPAVGLANRLLGKRGDDLLNGQSNGDIN